MLILIEKKYAKSPQKIFNIREKKMQKNLESLRKKNEIENQKFNFSNLLPSLTNFLFVSSNFKKLEILVLVFRIIFNRKIHLISITKIKTKM